jgi:hypothetical protein
MIELIVKSIVYEGFSSERNEKCDLTVNDDHSTRFMLHHVHICIIRGESWLCLAG